MCSWSQDSKGICCCQNPHSSMKRYCLQKHSFILEWNIVLSNILVSYFTPYPEALHKRKCSCLVGFIFVDAEDSLLFPLAGHWASWGPGGELVIWGYSSGMPKYHAYSEVPHSPQHGAARGLPWLGYVQCSAGTLSGFVFTSDGIGSRILITMLPRKYIDRYCYQVGNWFWMRFHQRSYDNAWHA